MNEPTIDFNASQESFPCGRFYIWREPSKFSYEYLSLDGLWYPSLSFNNDKNHGCYFLMYEDARDFLEKHVETDNLIEVDNLKRLYASILRTDKDIIVKVIKDDQLFDVTIQVKGPDCGIQSTQSAIELKEELVLLLAQSIQLQSY